MPAACSRHLQAHRHQTIENNRKSQKEQVSKHFVMHQHPRPAPRSASSASSPQTNPMRSNNQREDASRAPSRQSIGSESDRSAPGAMLDTTRSDTGSPGQSPEMARLNLIVQVGKSDPAQDLRGLNYMTALFHQGRSDYHCISFRSTFVAN